MGMVTGALLLFSSQTDAMLRMKNAFHLFDIRPTSLFWIVFGAHALSLCLAWLRSLRTSSEFRRPLSKSCCGLQPGDHPSGDRLCPFSRRRKPVLFRFVFPTDDGNALSYQVPVLLDRDHFSPEPC